MIINEIESQFNKGRRAMKALKVLLIGLFILGIVQAGFSCDMKGKKDKGDKEKSSSYQIIIPIK
jgi:hypothetical protein